MTRFGYSPIVSEGVRCKNTNRFSLLSWIYRAASSMLLSNVMSCRNEVFLDALIFFLAIISIVICVATSFVALSAFTVSQRKLLLFLALFIISYSIEQCLVFLNEYLTQNLSFQTASFHQMEDPLLRVFIAIAIYQSLWLAFCEFLDEKRKLLRYLPILGFFVFSLILLYVPSMDESYRKWALYSVRQLFLLWIVAYCVFKYLTTDSKVNRVRYKRKSVLLLIFTLLVIFTFVEDTLIMLIIDPNVIAANEVLKYMYRRNTSELIFVMLIVFYTLRLSIQALKLKGSERPQSSRAGHHTQAQDLLPYFTKRHDLTPRESEILAYVIDGEDNYQIAKTLQLATGTVKTHTHNIFKKTSTSNREELLRIFWAEK